ncbi:MAG: response regulator [Candidatus Thalassarchaeaceae archaeon]|nr:response regulator [Candidatus Thalassarchaeaceae archaeon]MDP6703217.1 response regulator [Candidatus Thalassarchaeaceae archaeon]MDP7003988.1 response regulator [Candidatus Thalassarchaeaceae archaeon]
MTSSGEPTALIVLANRISAGRIQSILRQKGWISEICGDGDKAVDRYVKIKPALVFIGLDIPTLDGHVAALEMRESDPTARIVFVTSRTRLAKAEDAAFSTGAVAVLISPLTQADFDQKWDAINGPIPDAPGLADLDELYPELEEKLQPESPTHPGLPPLGLGGEGMPPLPNPPNGEPIPRFGRRTLSLAIFLALSALGVGAAYLLGAI